MSAQPLRSTANPVRKQPRCFRPGRVVQVRFTEFARIGAQGGLLTMFGPTPDEAIRDVVRRLKASPAELRAQALQLGDVALLQRMPADAEAEFGPGTLKPVAFVEGLAQHEIAESLEWLSPSVTAQEPAQ